MWDVGLGAAANAIAVLRATRDVARPLRLVSFDDTAEPLAFALENAEALGYLRGYESAVRTILDRGQIQFTDGSHEVNWQFHLGDFPAWCAHEAAGILPAIEPGFQPSGDSAESRAGDRTSCANPGGRMPPSTSGRMPDATSPNRLNF